MTPVHEDSPEREHCLACGFDSDLYDRADTISSQRVIPAVIRAGIEGLPSDILTIRPDDITWSINEYLDHVRETTFGNRLAIEMSLSEPDVDLGAAPASEFSADAKKVDLDKAIDGLTYEFEALHSRLLNLSKDQWGLGVLLDGDRHTVEWFARHVLHDGLHHLADIGRIRHRFGHGAATQTGIVAQINISGGGVPKHPVDSARLGPRGVDGDVQADRRHHGRPIQAVCLWSAEVIATLRSEGHPIEAGNAGENITAAGIDWAQLRPGGRIAVGPVPMLISAHAVPCAKNAQWFHDRDFNRILHEQNPGQSRLYAIPLGEGIVRVGDRFTVEP